MTFSPDRPPSRETQEVSDAEWEALHQDAARYLEAVKRYDLSVDKSQSFNHIVRNLATVALFVTEEAQRRKKPVRESYDSKKGDVDALRRYLQLLEDFPDFAEKELNSSKGYFPELYSTLALGPDFVDAYEKALRGQAQ